LEQKKEDYELIRDGKNTRFNTKIFPPSQKLGTTCAISHTAMPHPRIALLLILLLVQATY